MLKSYTNNNVANYLSLPEVWRYGTEMILCISREKMMVEGKQN